MGIVPIPLAASDAELLLVGGLLLSLGIAAALIADRMRIPGLILFLGLGMLIGSEGPGGVDFDDVELTRTLGVIGISLILFEGGLSAGWREIRPVLGTALSLAILGTVFTALLAGLATQWIFGFGMLESLIVGSAIAATDSAAIFAVLRGSRLRRKLARTLEGESGMNDPVALLLVTGFIDWIMRPDYGALDMGLQFAGVLAFGALLGVLIGQAARWAFRTLTPPTPGLYPVISIATAALAYGLTETLGGSGFMAVYITGLLLGSGEIAGHRTVVTFHSGLAWVAQITLFFVLGLLVLPSQVVDVAGEALILSAFLMLVARPLASFAATVPAGFNLAERFMMGWAGLRGATPILFATFPVIAGIPGSEKLFAIVFFVVLSTTLIQGVTFEPLADRMGLTTTAPALPQPLHESGTIRELGGDVLAYRVPPGAAIDGLMVKELGLPRDALVNVIVRDGAALPPRGSTVVRAGDELHLLVRREVHSEVTGLTQRWEEGPVGPMPSPQAPIRSTPSVLSVHPRSEADGDPSHPETVDGIPVTSHVRTRHDRPGSLVALADGRYAVVSTEHVALGGRRQLARWCRRRAPREVADPQARAWWQEVVGALHAR